MNLNKIMSNPFNNMSFVMFLTTLGRRNRQDIYKYTLNYLNNNEFIRLKDFGNKNLSIKVHNEQEEVFEKMITDFHGFNVIKEIGNNNLDANPHREDILYGQYILNNYSVSAANIFGQINLDKEFIWWNEDDCLPIWDNNSINYMLEAQKVLRDNPNIFCISLNGVESSYHLDNDNLFGNTKYNFRPHIARTSDMKMVSQCFKDNLNKLRHGHPEGIFETIIKYLNPNAEFLQFNSKFLGHVTIGGPDFEDIINKYKLTY